MYLLPLEAVPGLDTYYTNFRQGSSFLGFMPCSNPPTNSLAKYYSVEAPNGRVVPVFFVPDMVFDSDPAPYTPSPALFFKGGDDGHTGVHVESEKDAQRWINDCKYVDFNQLLEDAINGKFIGLSFHN